MGTSNERRTTRFTVERPGASRVYLLADFNDWSTTALEMKRTGEQRWEADVPLPPGSYRYAFFVMESDRAPLRTTVEGLGLREVGCRGRRLIAA